MAGPSKRFCKPRSPGDVTVEEMRKACGLTRASYYGEPSGTGRGFDDTFPNSEELRQVAEYYGLGDNGWVSLLVEFGWLESRPGTLRIPFTAGTTDRQLSMPINLVPLREALSRYENASVLLVSPNRDEVNLVPLRRAIEEQLDGSLVVFNADPPADEE